jgi:hypothetical protein
MTKECNLLGEMSSQSRDIPSEEGTSLRHLCISGKVNIKFKIGIHRYENTRTARLAVMTSSLTSTVFHGDNVNILGEEEADVTSGI